MGSPTRTLVGLDWSSPAGHFGMGPATTLGSGGLVLRGCWMNLDEFGCIWMVGPEKET